MATLISRRVKSYLSILDQRHQFLQPWKNNACSIHFSRKEKSEFLSPKLLNIFTPVCEMCNNSLEVIDNILVKITEEENEFYHSFLENCPKYKSYLLTTSILTDADNDCKIKQSESVTRWRKSLEYVAKDSMEKGLDVLREEKVRNVIKNWRENTPSLTDRSLFHDMRLFTKMNLRFGLSKSFRPLRFSLANTFNQEFTHRAPQWDVATTLVAMDIFYHLRCYHVPALDFIDKFFHKVNMAANSLSKEEIVLVHFYANLRRKCPEFILNKLTKCATANLDSLLPEEVAILCLGHFKCNNLRTSSFHPAVCQYLTDHSSKMESLNISAMTKFLNSASHDGFFRNLAETKKEKLLVNLEKKIVECHFSGVFHVLSMCERWRCVTPGLVGHLEDCVTRDNVRRMRVKDLAKAAMLIGNLSPMMRDPGMLLEVINTEMMSGGRGKELTTHFHNLCLSLDGMTRAGVYPDDLIRRLFDRNASQYFREFEVSYTETLARLLERIKIEHREILTGDLQHLDVESTHTGKKVRLSNARIEFMKDVRKILSWMLSDGHLKETKAFSDDNPDIEVRVRENGECIPVEEWEGEDRFQRILFVLQSTKDFYKVFLRDGVTKHHIKGYSNMKLRQLRKLKFIPVPIVQYNYYTSPTKEDYIKQQVLQHAPDQTIQFKDTGFRSRRSYR